jgi:2-haloacid dehalogenase
MDFSRFTTISFDCYGTLIDWESGILSVLRTMLRNHGQRLSDSEILELYGQFEAQAESGPYQSYREVLQAVVRAFADRCHFDATPNEVRSLHESVTTWQPFPDTVHALGELKERYRLAVISNIDDDLFAQTGKLLEVKFEAVITAQQARSYKPSINNFQLALRTIAISPDQLLHAGQSIFHDVVPARTLGISTAWVNRRSARPGVGAVRTSDAPGAAKKPDLEVRDLAEFAAAVLAPHQQVPREPD